MLGNIADRYLGDALPKVETVALLEAVEQRYPTYLTMAAQAPDPDALGFRARYVQEALDATAVALTAFRQSGALDSDATANALRAIVKGQLPPEQQLITKARSILLPAEAHGGKIAFRRFAPLSLILIVVFTTMYVQDKRRGGYRAVRLQHIPAPSSSQVR
jgi:hypothetical protein